MELTSEDKLDIIHALVVARKEHAHYNYSPSTERLEILLQKFLDDFGKPPPKTRNQRRHAQILTLIK